MNDHNNIKTFIARTQFYRHINGQLQPRFLRRNLNHIFDSHEKLIRGAVNAPDAIAKEDRRRRARWKPPTDKMMDEYIEGDRPKLTIDSFFLRSTSDSLDAGVAIECPTNSRFDDGPSWLPHPNERPIPCQVAVNIHYKHLAKTQVYYETRSADIFRLEDTRKRRRVFSVRLQSPFVISADQLKVALEELRDDQSRCWERRMTDKYSLEISIACSNSRDSAEFLAELEGGNACQYISAPGNEGVIKTIWGDPNSASDSPGLPALPPENSLLSLRRARGHKSLLLPYGLQPNMGWTTRDDSILTTYNKQLRRLRSGHQMPTPSPSEDAEPPRKRARTCCSVRYQFWSGTFVHRSVHMAELKCIFCPNDKGHSSIERLYSHYAAHHEHFSISVEDDDEDEDVKVFKMQLKEELLDYASDVPKDNFNWRAPPGAFDIAGYMSKHSRGQHTGWETEQSEPVAYVGERLVQGPHKIASKGRKGRPLAPAPPSLELEKPKVKDMLPVEVHDLPPRERKKHKVPDVPGIDFYRTSSKQVLHPGDMVSDSDEDPDESWLVQRQRRDLRNLGLDSTAQAFHELVNTHLDAERPMSDMLARDAIVRFARRHKRQLAQPGMKALFRDKLEMLKTARIISRTDLEYCLQIIPSTVRDKDVVMGGTSEEASTSSQPLPSKRRVNGLFDRHSSQGTMTHGASTHLTPNSKVRQAYLNTKPTSRLDLTTSTSGPDPAAKGSLMGHTTPFGRGRLLCRRTNGSRQKPYQGEIVELVKDSDEHIKVDEIRPCHLDWFKFLRILDDSLIFVRASDNIVCISNRLAPLVTDEKDWYAALEQAEREQQHQQHGDGTLIFELHTADSYQKLLESIPGSQESTRPSSSATLAQQQESAPATVRGRRQPWTFIWLVLVCRSGPLIGSA
ncbi:Putative polycomb protein, VEFS-Box [Septoria linicola]|uniref:Polycomb protein, VEFS-Box n=1 Tax=Septoria linicola TaxID=215465 RepID=A0A9Q9ANC3_9PEZI|nr:putative polycomb protein, VEFS-Box [Septoria linicola]USW50123.1 Putative polycomb protein, VEFS-Box [Septoria linicola]